MRVLQAEQKQQAVGFVSKSADMQPAGTPHLQLHCTCTHKCKGDRFWQTTCSQTTIKNVSNDRCQQLLELQLMP
jgi:hypothetical protein